MPVYMNIPKDTITEQKNNGKVHYSTNYTNGGINWDLLCVGADLATPAHFLSLLFYHVNFKKNPAKHSVSCVIKSMQMIL